MSNSVEKKIRTAAARAGRNGFSKRELLTKARLSAKEQKEFSAALKRLEEAGELLCHHGRYFAAKKLGLHTAVITRLNKTFGFAVQQSNDQEVFIPGKFLRGALPGDTVQLRYIPSRREEGGLEGEVIRILKEGSGEFSGVLVMEEGRLAVLPDSFARFPIPLVRGKASGKVGDKVTARVVLRGTRHADHRCRVLESFGASSSAAACADAVLTVNDIPREFSEAALAQADRLAARGIHQNELTDRLDLRSERIFTIDSADSKDLDDAVSLVKLGDCYQLGVHIADVSHYVTKGSPLDEEAFSRGTSLYYADRVIPMLPQALSNGICSLNPQEERLAFSALLTVGADGKLLDFDFRKSVICSRVKGVYSEVNRILEHTASEEILKKYAGLTDVLFQMEQLADILTANRVKRGAPEIETVESKILLDENGAVSDILPRERGKAERMIEEFMLLANEAAATLGKKLMLPFVYRVHEPPTPEKAENLQELLRLLGMSIPDWRAELRAEQLAAVLRKAKDTRYAACVNTYVLRSMAKAKYSEQPLGHFGLVLQDYAHFTSPIRRYPDLAIHRILSDLVAGMPIDRLQKKYGKFAPSAAQQATRTELRAMQAERECEDCYKAEYMAKHRDELFEGQVSSVTPQGLYVLLPNTVEGLIRTEELGEGYAFDGLSEMKASGNPKSYRIGDPIQVRCARADVNSGQIDFLPADSPNRVSCFRK